MSHSRLQMEIHAGLCNRMRALDSAMQLARKIDARLDVIWTLNHDFNCRFEELFDVPDVITSLVNKSVKNRMMRKAESWLFRVKRLSLDHCYHQSDVERLLSEGADFEALTRGASTFISTYSRFYGRDGFYSDFTLRQELRDVVDRYVSGFDQAVGVHIRRSDNAKAIEHSPTELFVERMSQEVAANPGTRFFLATDSPEVERELKAVFGDRVRTHEKASLDRDDPAAIKDAAIDLYCLAGCRKILGSYWSSFSETAAQLGGIQGITIAKAAPARKMA